MTPQTQCSRLGDKASTMSYSKWYDDVSLFLHCATAIMDLFSQNPTTPLAERMRPHSLDEVVGQQHLIAPGKPLYTAVGSGKIHSMLLWEPPGVGKTIQVIKSVMQLLVFPYCPMGMKHG